MSHPLSRRIDAVLDLDPAARALEFDGTWHTFAEVATLARRVAALADAVREAGLAEALIGTEFGGMVPLRMPHGDFVELRQRLPRVDFVDASPLCWTLRGRKSSAEAERIRQSVAITDAAYQALFAKVKSGIDQPPACVVYRPQ